MRRACAIVTSLVLSTSACATARHTTAPTRTEVYVAVGASETVGVGADDPKTQAWPTVFFHSALRPTDRYVNLGISGATVRRALDAELAKAVAAKPTLVTVWLNVNDIIARVGVSDYEAQLGELVHGLRRGGATRVLVANVPPLDILPAVRPFAGFVSSVVDSYNEAIARVAAREGAQVVDLQAAGEAAKQDGTAASLVGADGFHPSTAGHARVAAAFAAAYRER